MKFFLLCFQVYIEWWSRRRCTCSVYSVLVCIILFFPKLENRYGVYRICVFVNKKIILNLETTNIIYCDGGGDGKYCNICFVVIPNFYLFLIFFQFLKIVLRYYISVIYTTRRTISLRLVLCFRNLYISIKIFQLLLYIYYYFFFVI